MILLRTHPLSSSCVQYVNCHLQVLLASQARLVALAHLAQQVRYFPDIVSILLRTHPYLVAVFNVSICHLQARLASQARLVALAHLAQQVRNSPAKVMLATKGRTLNTLVVFWRICLASD